MEIANTFRVRADESARRLPLHCAGLICPERRTGCEQRSMMLAAKSLACARGDRLLFKELDFTLSAGEALHVAGNNGDGKTSLLRILAGLAQPESGAVLWNDGDIYDNPGDFRGSLVYVGHSNGLKDGLTVGENLREWSTLSSISPEAAAIDAALREVGLSGFAFNLIGALSQGQKRRAGLARLGLAGTRMLWILDEPLTALDAHACDTIVARLDRHLEAGGLLVYSSHQPLALRAGRATRLDISGASRC